MTEFDLQWQIPDPLTEYNQDRVKELLQFTELPADFFKGKWCLDAGCGNGRYTYAMQQLGGSVVSFDISPNAAKECKKINSATMISDILTFGFGNYDFALCWGVLHHLKDPKLGFEKVANRVKRGGVLHIMVYSDKHEEYPKLRELWKTLDEQGKRRMCEGLAQTRPERTPHGWYDALNPEYNHRFTEQQVRDMFIENGFTGVKRTFKEKDWNVNMQGTKT